MSNPTRGRPRPAKRGRGLKAGAAIAALLAVGLLGTRFCGHTETPNAASARPALDLDRYRLTFNEDFDTLDVSANGPHSRWVAHTPWNGDFGDARFLDPTPGRPFTLKDGILSITMSREAGQWGSGLLAANNSRNTGFSQSGGYFEVRAKLAHGLGVWPGIWLASSGKPGEIAPEVDIAEYYGRDPTSYMATGHLWKDGKDLAGKTTEIFVEPGSLESGFHTYGVSIDARALNFYLDRRLVATLPSSPDYLHPVYPIVNLAAGGGWPIDKLPPVSTMQIDYVRAYQIKD